MKRLSILGAIFLANVCSGATQPVKPAVVPAEFQWIRSLDTDLYVQKENGYGSGIQHFHLRLRYLDPDVNAFVGMQTDLDHFNHDLLLDDPNDPNRGSFLADMGANIGIVHKKTTWELDLMGATAAGKLGPATALVTEHRFDAHWMYYSRLQGDIFIGDGIFDVDEGICWTMKKSLGISLGYRALISLHMDRIGPHIGLRYSFDSPHIPFIFPSLG